MKNQKMVRISFYATLLLLALSATTSLAASSGGISILPYDKLVDAKRAWFIYKDIEPGAIIQDNVVIHNTTKTQIDFLIYPVDAENARDGGYAPKSDDAEKIDIGKWTTLDASEISLKPNEKKTIAFTIRVPEKVAIGDHAGTILVKRKIPEIRKEFDEQGREIESKSALSIVTRIGVRIYLTIAGPVIKKLSLDKLTFGKDNAGKPFFYFALANDGNVRLPIRGTLEIYDTEQKLLESIDVNLREIFPFTETLVPVEWKNQRDGKFIAKGIVPEPEGDKRMIATTKFEWTLPKIPTPVEINSTLQQLVIGAGIVIFVLFTIVTIMWLTLRRRK